MIQCGKRSPRVAVQRPTIRCEQLSVVGKSPNRIKCPTGTYPTGNDSAGTCGYILDEYTFGVYQTLGKS